MPVITNLVYPIALVNLILLLRFHDTKKSLALIGILLVITSFLVPISEKRLTENEWCDIPYTADFIWSVKWVFTADGDFQQSSDLRVKVTTQA